MCHFLGELKGENNFRCVKLLNSFNVWDNSSAEQWVEKIIYYLKKKLRIIIHIHKYFSKFWEFWTGTVTSRLTLNLQYLSIKRLYLLHDTSAWGSYKVEAFVSGFSVKLTLKLGCSSGRKKPPTVVQFIWEFS